MVKSPKIDSSKNLHRAVEKPSLQQAEAEQGKIQKQKRVSAQDAARMASQAGFQRTRKKGKGIDIGDSSQAPIPLPDDELDPEAWSQEGPEDAQGSLALAGAQFGEVAKAPEGGVSIGEAVVGSSFMPVEEDIAELQKIAERAPEPVPMLDEVTGNMASLFGIELGEDVPVGHRVLATGLVVAGEGDSVEVEDGAIKEKEMAGGLEKVTRKGHEAVDQAKTMNKGINKELNVQRTFMFKR